MRVSQADLDELDPNYGQSEVMSVRASGPIALFTNPAFRAERMTYPFPTHSAARGLLRAICPKASMDYRVRRILALKPIQYESYVTNEITRFGKEEFSVSDPGRRAQRNNTVLVDVDYVIDFQIQVVLPPRKDRPDDGVDKCVEMFSRAIRGGFRGHQPFWGLREYFAYCELITPAVRKLLRPIESDADAGLMYFDHPVLSPGGDRRHPVAKNYFTHMKMVAGVVDFPDWRQVLQQGMVLQ